MSSIKKSGAEVREAEVREFIFGLLAGYNTTSLKDGTKGFEDPNHPNADENGFVLGDDRTHGANLGLNLGFRLGTRPNRHGVRFVGLPTAVFGLAFGKDPVSANTTGHAESAEDCPVVMGTPLCNDDGEEGGNLLSDSSNGIYGRNVNFSRFRLGVDLPIGVNIKDRVDVYGLFGVGVQVFTADAYAALPGFDGLQKLGAPSPSGYVRVGGGVDLRVSAFVSIGGRVTVDVGEARYVINGGFDNSRMRSTPTSAVDASGVLTFHIPTRRNADLEPVEVDEFETADEAPAPEDSESASRGREITDATQPAWFQELSNNDQIKTLLINKAAEYGTDIATLLDKCGIKRILLAESGEFMVAYTNGQIVELQNIDGVEDLIENLTCQNCEETPQTPPVEPSPDVEVSGSQQPNWLSLDVTLNPVEPSPDLEVSDGAGGSTEAPATPLPGTGGEAAPSPESFAADTVQTPDYDPTAGMSHPAEETPEQIYESFILTQFGYTVESFNSALGIKRIVFTKDGDVKVRVVFVDDRIATWPSLTVFQYYLIENVRNESSTEYDSEE